MTTLHLQQASMSWRDSDRDAREDYRRIFDRDAHFVGFTEVYRDLDILRAEADRKGYRPVFGPTKSGKAETVLAIAPGVRLLDQGSLLINPADPGRPPAGGHSARYLTWAVAEWEGNEVAVAESHWVTARGTGRAAKRRQMSRAVADIIAAKAEGSALGFWMGDTNDDDNVNDDGSAVYGPLEAGGLVTVFDELGVHPPTHDSRHDSTIDIIGSYVPDVRVEAKRVEVHRGGNSDHWPVSAFYDIAPLGGARKHACPKCGLIHRPTKEKP